MDENHGARTAGQRAALITSALGLLLASLLAAAFGLATYLRSTNGRLVLALGALSVLSSARWAGGVVGVAVKGGGNPRLLGCALALATVIVPTLVLSLGAWAVQQFPFWEGRALGSLGAYVLKPLLWITPVSVLPACALGLLYAHLLRRYLA